MWPIFPPMPVLPSLNLCSLGGFPSYIHVSVWLLGLDSQAYMCMVYDSETYLDTCISN